MENTLTRCMCITWYISTIFVVLICFVLRGKIQFTSNIAFLCRIFHWFRRFFSCLYILSIGKEKIATIFFHFNPNEIRFDVDDLKCWRCRRLQTKIIHAAIIRDKNLLCTTANSISKPIGLTLSSTNKWNSDI